MTQYDTSNIKLSTNKLKSAKENSPKVILKLLSSFVRNFKRWR